MKSFEDSDLDVLENNLLVITELRNFFRNYNQGNIQTLVKLITSGNITRDINVPLKLRAAFSHISGEIMNNGSRANDERYPNEKYLFTIARILAGISGKVSGHQLAQAVIAAP